MVLKRKSVQPSGVISYPAGSGWPAVRPSPAGSGGRWPLDAGPPQGVASWVAEVGQQPDLLRRGGESGERRGLEASLSRLRGGLEPRPDARILDLSRLIIKTSLDLSWWHS